MSIWIKKRFSNWEIEKAPVDHISKCGINKLHVSTNRIKRLIVTLRGSTRMENYDNFNSGVVKRYMMMNGKYMVYFITVFMIIVKQYYN